MIPPAVFTIALFVVLGCCSAQEIESQRRQEQLDRVREARAKVDEYRQNRAR